MCQALLHVLEIQQWTKYTRILALMELKSERKRWTGSDPSLEEKKLGKRARNEGVRVT